MKKKLTTLTTSVAAIAVCTSLIAGSTYALFTSESSVNIAVHSAKVDVTATIEETNAYHGSYENGVYTESEGLYGGTYSLEGNTLSIDKFAPLDTVEVTLSVTNSSTISVKYRTVVSASEEDNALFEALNIYVDGVLYEGDRIESAYKTLEYNQNPTPVVVKIVFPDSADNNQYQDSSCTIHFTVEAVQANANVFDAVDFEDAVVLEENEDGAVVVSGLQEGVVVKSLDIPAEVNGAPVVIESRAFSGNSTIESVTVNCETISTGAFSGCENLKEVTIGADVKNIGDDAFKASMDLVDGVFTYTSSLEKVIFSEDSQLEEIGGEAFAHSDKLTTVVLPETLKVINYNAFYDCTSLESIVIPEGVTDIGSSAFANCDSITEVTLPGTLEYVSSDAFIYCENLTTVYFNGNVADWTFDNAMFHRLGNQPLTIVCLDGNIEVR